MNALTAKKYSNFEIKLIAMLCMFVDHLGKIIMLDSESFQTVCGAAGSIAFPLFAFLLTEGFVHTRNIKIYALRLLGFAVLSEIPFDLYFNNTLIEFKSNNVMFTLLIGLIILFVFSVFEKKDQRYLGLAVIAVALILLQNVLNIFDYGVSGLLAILVMYFFKDRPHMAYVVAVLTISLMNPSSVNFFALVGMLFVVNYNKEKGKDIKYLAYLFYPAHLILLYLLKTFIL